MRNLGLALVLIASVTAPHMVWAKKHAAGKRGRSAKTQKHSKRARAAHQSIAPSSDDALASVVSAHKSEEKPVMTSAVAPAPAPAPAARAAAEPVAPNAPMRMDNQTNDDEVPGARKKR
jgi:hypothetical protein